MLTASSHCSAKNISLESADSDDYPDTVEYAKDKLLAMEKIATGIYLSGHPLDQYKN